MSPRSPITTSALLVLAACASVALLACSDSADSAGGRAYRDAAGRDVTLPERAQRVVALSEPTLDAALALGLEPIATTAGRGQGTIAAYLGDRAADVESVGILGQPDIDEIASLGPDLILVDGTAFQDDAVIDKLQRFAPTVYVSKTGADWREAFERTAEVLGRSAEGRRRLARYDERVEDVRSRLRDQRDAEISIVRWGGIGLPAVLMREIAASRVLADLGLGRPPFQDRRGPGHSVPVSLERMELLDGDWIFFGSLGAGGAEGGVSDAPADVASARQALEYATDTPGFTRLRAYRNDRVVPVDGSAWTSAGGYLAAQVVLDDVERTLTAPR